MTTTKTAPKPAPTIALPKPAPTTALKNGLVMVSGEQATAWLEMNVNNRNLRTTWVTALATDMREGRWQVTGDPIKFDTKGVLIDGQHRLHAVVESGLGAVPMFVMTGLETSVRDVVDTGAARGANDVLTFAGLTNTNKLAAAARIFLARENGLLRHASTGHAANTKWTNPQILEYVQGHPDLPDYVHRGQALSLAVGGRQVAVWAYAAATLDAIDHDAWLDFESSLLEMRTDGAGDPRATLLKWVQARAVISGNSRQTTSQTLFAIFRCWNAWRLGEKLGKIQIAVDAYIPEPI